MTFLLRLIVWLGLIAGLGYAGMWALATFVEPQPRQVRETIPASKLSGKAP